MTPINSKYLEVPNASITGFLPYKQARDEFSSGIIDILLDILSQSDWFIQNKNQNTIYLVFTRNNSLDH